MKPITNPVGDRVWERRFAEFLKLRQRTGSGLIPLRSREFPLLPAWAQQQRRSFHRLPLERLRRLYRAGFRFDPRDRAWLSMFWELVDYQKETGRTDVPRKYRANPALANWVNKQRRDRRSLPASLGLATPRRQLLDRIGFLWQTREARWEEQFAALLAFKDRYGHCNVPRYGRHRGPLANWVREQRDAYREQRLPAAKARRLQDVGFQWDPDRELWEQRFQELVAYQKRFGHCNVPMRWRENRELATWVSVQRLTTTKHYTKARRQRLAALGFLWNLREVRWEQRYRQLAAFKKRFGHCRVPHDWRENRELAEWVKRQRYVKKHLTPRRRQRLRRIGFFGDR